jgi:hypothetical protein
MHRETTLLQCSEFVTAFGAVSGSRAMAAETAQHVRLSRFGYFPAAVSASISSGTAVL